MRDLPKIELHLHLDCSLSYEYVKRYRPSMTYQGYLNMFTAPKKCRNLADYLRRAVYGYKLLQSEEQLRIATDDLFRQLKEDSVVYAEIRFAPLLHIMEGLTPDKVVEVVNEAVSESFEKYGIYAGIILCTLRHFTEEQSFETVKLVKKYNNTNVVGFDIAGNEEEYPIDNHIKAFQYAFKHQIKCTAHAGEAKGSESVWETLEKLNPLRLGHGVRSIEDEALIAYLKENNIHLEICPTSNIQVDVFDQIVDHPVDRIFNSGVSMSLNTDGRTISNVSLTHEYKLMREFFNWNNHHFKKCNLEAIKHSFMEDDVLEKLKLQIDEAY